MQTFETTKSLNVQLVSKLFFVILLLTLGVFYVQAAWTAPTSAPPGGNVSPPINEGTSAQTKSSNLFVDNLAVYGNMTLGSYMTVGDATTCSSNEEGALRYHKASGNNCLQLCSYNTSGGVYNWASLLCVTEVGSQ